MHFQNKLIAEYSELTNQYLDNLPVEKLEDFEALKEALKVITEPTQNHQVSPSLTGRITAIKEIIDQPEIYVQNSEHYGEFKSIIVQRVASKIQELDALSLDEKEKYITDQKKLKERAIQNQTIMNGRQEPAIGSEAHTISEEEWLQQQQARFQRQLPQNFVYTRAQGLEPLPIPTQEEIAQRESALTSRLEQLQRGNAPLTDLEIDSLNRELYEVERMQRRRANAIQEAFILVVGGVAPSGLNVRFDRF